LKGDTPEIEDSRFRIGTSLCSGDEDPPSSDFGAASEDDKKSSGAANHNSKAQSSGQERHEGDVGDVALDKGVELVLILTGGGGFEGGHGLPEAVRQVVRGG